MESLMVSGQRRWLMDIHWRLLETRFCRRSRYLLDQKIVLCVQGILIYMYTGNAIFVLLSYGHYDNRAYYTIYVAKQVI